jgi:predicted DNA-binding transcriptional regulator AlpA
MTRCLDMKRLCVRLCVSRATVLRWMARNDPTKKLHRVGGTRRVLVAESELNRWITVNTLLRD